MSDIKGSVPGLAMPTMTETILSVVQSARDAGTFGTERFRGQNNEAFNQWGFEAIEALVEGAGERFMWEWLTRGLGPETAYRETMEKVERQLNAVRDVVRERLTEFATDQSGRPCY